MALRMVTEGGGKIVQRDEKHLAFDLRCILIEASVAGAGVCLIVTS